MSPDQCRAARERLNWTRRELSEATDVPLWFIAAFEDGKEMAAFLAGYELAMRDAFEAFGIGFQYEIEDGKARAGCPIMQVMAADLALAVRMGWPVAVPLFATAIGDPNLRAALGDRRPRPGDPNWERDAYALVADAAARAHARAIEIDRRAARLLAAVPRLRTKGAEVGVAALLAEE